MDSVTKLTTDASNIAKGITDSIKATKTLGSQANAISGMASTAPTFLQGVTPEFSNAIMKVNVGKMANDFSKALNDYSTLKINDNSGLKHLSLNSDNIVKPGGISNLGKAGIGLAASIAGDLGNKFISDGFNTVPGTLISNIGSTAGTVLSLVPGVGWAVGPAVAFGSKILGGLYNRAFGSEYKDNGASAYTDWLNNQNINVSNEQGANLLSSIGEGSRATSRNGWLNHSAERRADATNTA